MYGVKTKNSVTVPFIFDPSYLTLQIFLSVIFQPRAVFKSRIKIFAACYHSVV